MSIFLEYIIVFILVAIFYHITIKLHYKNYNKDKLPVELLYLKKIYKISVNKENYKSYINILPIVNSFIITTIYIMLMYLLKSWVLRIIIGVVLLILLLIICYGLLGRYYLKKEGR